MRHFLIFFCLLLAGTPTIALAQSNPSKTNSMHIAPLPRFGIQMNYLSGNIYRTSPKHTKQYGVQLQWFPKALTWEYMQLFVQGGFEHLTTTTQLNHFPLSANSYALGMLFRVHFRLTSLIQPYFVIGTQPGYFSQRDFGNHHLGIHFEFRDTIGFGLFVSQHLALGVYFIHYSHLFGYPNPGVTVPMQFSLAYQF